MSKKRLDQKIQPAESSGFRDFSPEEIKLMEFLQGLDGDYRHSFTLVCRGNSPSHVLDVMEHRDVDLHRSERGR